MILQNLEAIRNVVAQSCRKSQRDPSSVRIMAVTKGLSVEIIKDAISEGLTYIGENRVQEARDKANQDAFSTANLCLIGHLQTNKASMAARLFQEIHSIDSLKIAKAVSKFAQRYKSSPIPCLVQVNSGYDPKKYGILPKDTEMITQEILSMPGLDMKGFMTVPPLGDLSLAQDSFKRLRDLRDHLLMKGFPRENLEELSMGMSRDYHIAVSEGATIIRLGTVLLGERPV